MDEIVVTMGDRRGFHEVVVIGLSCWAWRGFSSRVRAMGRISISIVFAVLLMGLVTVTSGLKGV